MIINEYSPRFTNGRYCIARKARSLAGLDITFIDSLGPNDTIWGQASGSTLAQAMACA